MPTWSNRLPPEGNHMGFQLRRTPTAATLGGIITCDIFLVCDTHFWHGRTVPCEREVNDEGKTLDDSNCPACREKQGYRTHVYVSAFDPKRREHFLFECSTNAAKAFAEYHEAASTLRGCAFHASRAKQTPNGKVSIVCCTANMANVQLPQPPDLAKALCVIWRIPLTGLSHQLVDERLVPDLAVTKSKHSRSHVNPEPLRNMRSQPDNEPDPPTMAEILAGNGEQLKTMLTP